ncbi:hypothetical protein CMI42_01885 [Candidatus Pacearchaeota archaeon]|nr:hypothetical protein [Candidatus Pacearchaeota archaeon]
MKKQIVFIESYPEIMTYKIARILRKKGYETISIRLLKSKGLSEDFYKKAYDKIIHFNLAYHKINIKNIPSILKSSIMGMKDFLKAYNQIRKLKPYLVVGRAYPSWPIAMARYLYKGPLIYFPYDIRSITQVSQTKESKNETKRLSDLKQFELDAEKYCFKNADGIIHKGSPEEIEHLKNGIYKDVKICNKIINILPYCSEEFIVPINNNKLSKKDNEIHTVYIGASGGTDPKGTCDELFDYSWPLVNKKIHVHFYIKPNTLTKDEIVRLYKNAAGDLFDTGYFHLHHPLEPDEIVQEISKYDYGLTFYNHVGDDQGYSDLNAKFTTGNKIASYFEAGLPLFYSTAFDFLHETMKKYNLDLPIKDLKDAEKIGEKIKDLDYNKLIERVSAAREDYLMEKHFPEIEKFFKEVAEKKIITY